MAKDFSLDVNAQILRDCVYTLLARDGAMLKPKQRDAFAAMAASDADEIAHSYFKLPTGFGKTVMFAMMARQYVNSLTHAEQSSNRVIILVPRLSLVDQTLEKLSEFAEIRGAEFNSRVRGDERADAVSGSIIVSTYQSMEKLISEIGVENIGLVIADEAHHALGPKTLKLMRDIAKHTPIVGFTATPTYSDNRGVSDLLEHEIYSMDIRDGVEHGMLCPVKNVLYRPSVAFNVVDVPSTSAGEFDYDKLFGNMAGQVKSEILTREIAKIYTTGGDGDLKFRDMRAMINCPSIDVAIAQAAAINKMAGREVACAIHSQSKNFDELKSGFKNGEYSVVCQVNTMTEGFDDPTVSLCINYPSRSAVKIEQSAGRVVRVNDANPGKVAYVLDTVFRSYDGESLDQTLVTATIGRQVIFQDVAGGFEIVPHKFNNSNQDRGHSRGARPQNVTLGAENFDVVTDSATLIELKQKHDAWRMTNYVAKKTSEWLSARDLTATCMGRRTKVARALKAVQKQFPNIRIERKIGPGGIRPCVHVDDFHKFISATQNTNYPLTLRDGVGKKTSEWLTVNELKEFIVGAEYKLQNAIQSVLNNIHKYRGLRVEYRKSGGDMPRCVHIDDVDKFIRAAGKEGIKLTRRHEWPQKTANVLSSSELRTAYIIGQPRDITSAMEFVFKNIEKHPNVHMGYYQGGRNRVLCLDKNDIDAFLAAANNPKLKRANRAVEKAAGWIPASELTKQHIIFGDYIRVKDAVDVVFANRARHPNVKIMEMQSGSNVIPCLEKTDENIAAFIAAAAEHGKSLMRAGDEKNWISLDKLTRLLSGTNAKIASALRTMADKKFTSVRTLVTTNGRGGFYYLHVDDIDAFIRVAGALGYKFSLKPEVIEKFNRGVSVLDAATRVQNKKQTPNNPQNTK